MYILTVLLHKKWDGHKLQTDEMSGHRHYRSELSFRRKKHLRCTAHTTISLSSQVMSMFQKKQLVIIYNRGKQTSSRDYKKWLGDCSQYSHISMGKNPTNWPWFHKRIPSSTGLSCTNSCKILRNLILKIIPLRQGINRLLSLSL